MQRRILVVTQAVRLIRIVVVDYKAGAVIHVEPVFRAKPYESLAVLQNAIHRAVGEALFDRDTLEPEALDQVLEDKARARNNSQRGCGF